MKIFVCYNNNLMEDKLKNVVLPWYIQIHHLELV